jgi:hypothetical protein
MGDEHTYPTPIRSARSGTPFLAGSQKGKKMSKKLTMLGLAALGAAMLALPAAASAGNWHLEPSDGSLTGPNITIAGGAPTFSLSNGTIFKGTAITGTATFDTSSTTTGSIPAGLKFTGVTFSSFPCNSSGQPSGTVVTTPLTFHLEKIDTETPGLLLTGNAGHVMTFTCAGITFVVNGNGILGDVTNKCNEEIEKGTLDFQATSSGQQKYKQVTTTGTIFDWTFTSGSGSNTMAMESTLSLTLSKKSKVNCTLP